MSLLFNVIYAPHITIRDKFLYFLAPFALFLGIFTLSIEIMMYVNLYQ